MDMAAAAFKMDRVEIRRRNLIKSAQMPFQTALFYAYDSGDFATVLDKGLALADWEGFKARKKESKKRGMLRGIGICAVLEHAGGAPIEGAEMTFPGGNSLVLTLNVQSTGQSHATVFPRIVAERLGIKFEQIQHRHGDSAHEVAGYASVGSRSAMTVGHSMVKTIEAIVAKGKKVASVALEAGENDIEFKNGAFNVVGTDRRISLFETAAKAAEMKKKGEIPESLDTKLQTDTPLTFPNGCHVAEVEIDPQTGHLKLAGYSAVDDCGNVLDTTIVEGQTHGAAAMGIGQALLENTAYDESGQLLSGSFMDYAMPRADQFPLFVTSLSEVPSTNHPLGFRGGGEGGITPALGVIMNAVVDALAEFGVTHIDMPASPERVWQAIRAARSQALTPTAER